jgi:hypothetical protein
MNTEHRWNDTDRKIYLNMALKTTFLISYVLGLSESSFLSLQHIKPKIHAIGCKYLVPESMIPIKSATYLIFRYSINHRDK